jgi:chromosome segregation ATPase
VLFGASKRLRELEEEILKLKRAIADRDLDWDEMRARCKRLLDRTEKQYRAMSPDADDEPNAAPPANLPPTTMMPSPDRMAKIQAQLAERNRKKGAA